MFWLLDRIKDRIKFEYRTMSRQTFKPLPMFYSSQILEEFKGWVAAYTAEARRIKSSQSSSQSTQYCEDANTVRRNAESTCLGNSSTQLYCKLEEQYEEAWLIKCTYLIDWQCFTKASARKMITLSKPEDPPHWTPIPKPNWLLTSYCQDVLSRIDEVKAQITSIFGKVLKIDSTKKVSFLPIQKLIKLWSSLCRIKLYNIKLEQHGCYKGVISEGCAPTVTKEAWKQLNQLYFDQGFFKHYTIYHCIRWAILHRVRCTGPSKKFFGSMAGTSWHWRTWSAKSAGKSLRLATFHLEVARGWFHLPSPPPYSTHATGAKTCLASGSLHSRCRR